jgi:two-component system sensor histidine kinase/response regulator
MLEGDDGARESRARILVVDDSEANRLVVRGLLAPLGYEITLVESGARALEVFQERELDLVMLDVMMPEMDGFETCAELRRLPGGEDIPVLFLTALGDAETHEEALRVGADDFLTKPVGRLELLLRVRSLTRLKRLQRSLEKSEALLREQRDELLRAHEMRRALAAMVVHDLKSPLAGIMLNASYLVDSHLDAERAAAAGDIVHASRKLERMTLDLLDVERSERGELRPRPREVDLERLLRGCVDEATRRASMTGHRVELRAELSSQAEGAHVAARATLDPDQVARALDNLLDNAFKYAPRGTTVELRARVVDGMLQLEVCDEGPAYPRTSARRSSRPS